MIPQTASMVTRNGVRLDADVYRPETPGAYPVLLMRQPYGRRIASTICYAHPAWYAAQGYIVVIQDVRGRGSSEGRFRIFETEDADGADAIAWAAALPGSTGAVGMYGFSYQGTSQLLAATQAPPALRAIAPAMIGWDLRSDWAYQDGAFCLSAGLGWALQLAAETARLEGDAAAYAALRKAAGRPVTECRPQVIHRHRHLSHYHDWIDQPEDGPYWHRISPAARATEIAWAGVPALFIGGWYDPHLPGTMSAFRALAPRLPARLVVGPWGHFPWGRRLGALDFGPQAAGRIDQLQIRWFDRWLKGVRNGIDEEHPVRLFDMGERQWREDAAWPEAERVFHLHGSGRAALDEADGGMDETAPPDDGVECVVHDPWRPVPSVGGVFGSPSGPVDRAAIDARPDVLTFTTPPARAPMLLAGRVRADLRIDSDAPDFDIACTLSRVTPAGQVYPIAEGYRRVPSGSGTEAVAMRATCVTLAPGEALRLSIAGAAFPAFPVNPGTGEDPTHAHPMSARIITLRVRHGSTLCIGG